MISSRGNHFHQVSWGLDKNCRFFTNGQVLNVSCFFHSDLSHIDFLKRSILKVKMRGKNFTDSRQVSEWNIFDIRYANSGEDELCNIQKSLQLQVFAYSKLTFVVNYWTIEQGVKSMQKSKVLIVLCWCKCCYSNSICCR